VNFFRFHGVPITEGFALLQTSSEFDFTRHDLAVLIEHIRVPFGLRAGGQGGKSDLFLRIARA
jgi:hypothetical protein